MMTTLERCDVELIPGRGTQSVILTEGCTMPDGRVIVGVFADEDDARSETADDLAIAKLTMDSLSDEHRDIARRNSEAL